MEWNGEHIVAKADEPFRVVLQRDHDGAFRVFHTCCGCHKVHELTLRLIDGDQLETVWDLPAPDVAERIAAGADAVHEKDLLVYERANREAAEQNKALRAAIREHRDQRLDDRCWLDDQKLYAVLGEGVLTDNDMPPREEFLKNCARFYDRRCQAGDWPSYQQLEATIAEQAELIRALRSELAGLND